MATRRSARAEQKMGQDEIQEGGGGLSLRQPSAGPEPGPLGPIADPAPGDELHWDGAPSRQGLTPRENPTLGGGIGGGISSTPRRPSTPTPMAGSVSAPQGPMPFSPLPAAPAAALANPASRGLLGSLGGLKGGGLGLPLDSTSNQQSDPISTLMKLLQGSMGNG